MIAGAQAVGDFHQARLARAHPDLHLLGLAVHHPEHELAIRARHQRRLGHRQRVTLLGQQLQLDQHARLQDVLGVVDQRPRQHRAGAWIDLGVHRRHRALECALGVGRAARAQRYARRQPCQFGFRNGEVHLDAVDVMQGGDHVAGADQRAHADHAQAHAAGEGRANLMVGYAGFQRGHFGGGGFHLGHPQVHLGFGQHVLPHQRAGALQHALALLQPRLGRGQFGALGGVIQAR